MGNRLMKGASADSKEGAGRRSSGLGESSPEPQYDASGLAGESFAAAMVKMRSNSFLRELREDPESKKNAPNQRMREVKSGHYVIVKPTPLPLPMYVLHSKELASDLGLTEEQVFSDDFVKFFSGDVDVVPGSEAWATPYALSIYGNFQGNRQCPFQNGHGYGDGRALSIQEMVAPSGQRWELQLKGAGRTPFARTGDGRAVLRSSIREFLVSEAMHHMGVGTTRALSLVVSRQERVMRPIPEEDKHGTDMESCAISCRVAPSFLRIGHFEVFGRRAGRPSTAQGCQRAEDAVTSLQELVDHALKREFGGVAPGSSVSDRAWALLTGALKNVAGMTADWLRVGFCQGNFNGDNCLINGKTMDYGPFGFVEQFDPNFGSWVGSGSHFAFMNQPQAGLMNMRTLTEALEPLLQEELEAAWKKVKEQYLQASAAALNEVWRKKLGLAEWSEEAEKLQKQLLELMRISSADWTITWRQLAACLEVGGDNGDAIFKPLVTFQGQAYMANQKGKWIEWLQRWMALVDKQAGGREPAAMLIRQTSPKYVPREWMLKEAYVPAQKGDPSKVEELFGVFKQPFTEQKELELKFFTFKDTVSIS